MARDEAEGQRRQHRRRFEVWASATSRMTPMASATVASRVRRPKLAQQRRHADAEDRAQRRPTPSAHQAFETACHSCPKSGTAQKPTMTLNANTASTQLTAVRCSTRSVTCPELRSSLIDAHQRRRRGRHRQRREQQRAQRRHAEQGGHRVDGPKVAAGLQHAGGADPRIGAQPAQVDPVAELEQDQAERDVGDSITVPALAAGSSRAACARAETRPGHRG